jgi:hypothetical protein
MFIAQIPTLEEKLQHLDNKVIDILNDTRAKELSLEESARPMKTTRAKMPD